MTLVPLQLQIDYNFWGFILEFVGIGIGIILVIVVFKLDNNRRKREEEYYKSQAKSNLEQITHIYRDVTTISNGTSKGTWDEQEQEEITYQLSDYFSDNYPHIRYLIDDTTRCLEKWQSLSTDQQKNVREMIDALRWLITKYFPQDAGSIATRNRIWTQHFKELHEKKDRINGLLATI